MLLKWERSKQHRNWTMILMQSYVSTKLVIMLWLETTVVAPTGSLVVERKGPLSYTVQLDSGVIWWRHIDQLRDRVSVTSQEEGDVPWGNTTPPESETPDQESSDQSRTVNTEPAGMSNPTETPNEWSYWQWPECSSRWAWAGKETPQQGSSMTPEVHVTVKAELNLKVNNSEFFVMYNFPS